MAEDPIDTMEAAYRGLDFVLNRLDGIAEQVIAWMPEDDNEVHHNAVEQLQRAFTVTREIRARLRAQLGYRWPDVDRYDDSALAGDLSAFGAHNLRRTRADRVD